VFCVNLAQIDSVVPAIHCRTRFNDFVHLAHKWSPNHHRKLRS